MRDLPRELWILYAGTTITRLGAFVFPYLTIYLSEARGYGFDAVGLILSVGAIGLLIGNVAGGWLTDRTSCKRTMMLALLLNAIGFAGLAGRYEQPWIYAALLLIGYTGMGMYTPAANTLIADRVANERRAFAYTVNYVCVNVGMAMGPLMAGFLASVGYMWIFVGDVASSLLCILIIAAGIRDRRRGGTSRDGAAVRGIGRAWLRHPAVLVFCLAYFFLIAPLMGLEYAVPLLVKTTFDAPLAYVGVVYTVNATVILTLSFLIERLLRDRRVLPMMVVAGLFWTGGLLTLLLGFSVGALLLCTAVWTIGEIIGSILVPSYIAARVERAVKGRFMALNDLVRSAAGVICPIGLGLIWSGSGVHAVLCTLLALPVLGTIAYTLMALGAAPWRRVARPALAGET